MPDKNTVTITDNRHGKTYTLPIENGTIRAMDLRQIKTGPEDFGVMTYDPAFMNTASCQSAITLHRRRQRYPAVSRISHRTVRPRHCTFLEVAYLLLYGELPTAAELKEWVQDITHHTMLHETTKKFLEGFRYNAHPMGMFISTVAALSTVYPDARNVHRSRDPPALQIRG